MEYDDGITLQIGAVGGWAFMISRDVYKKVGKLRTINNRIFFAEDEDYVKRCGINGYICGILGGVKCFHATGPYYNKLYKSVFDDKMDDYKKNDFSFHKINREIKIFYNKIKKKIFKKGTGI